MLKALPRLAASSRPWLIAGALWLALAAVASVALWHLRREALESQARELDLLSLALADEVDRGLQGAQEGLQAVRDEWAEGHLPAPGPEAERALRRRAELMPLVESLWLVDADERLQGASDSRPAPTLQSFWPAPARLHERDLAISTPWTPPGDREPYVALAIRAPGGWVVAGVPDKALLGAFSAAAPAADARMAVWRSDGALLAGASPSASAFDSLVRATRTAGRRDVQVLGDGAGSLRLFSRHRLPRYGIDVVLTRDLDAVLAGWRGAAQLTGLAIVLLLAIMAVAVRYVQRAERRRREAQLALEAQRTRASRLESLGTLAGGVAHDFNNVLAAIIGFGEMAQDAAPAGSGQARQLDKVLQAALRGKALVERVLAFSRGGARQSTVFELEPVVEEALELLASTLRPGIVLERRFEASDARVRGDPTHAFEAVMNLCANAMQAMPDGGMLSVSLERVHVIESRVLSHSTLGAGDHLALTVSDQGAGIAPEVMEHLFEPFFTTRAAQSGTGLGLAVVHGVVAEFGGAIDVRSAPGEGATFTLYLPACDDAADAPEAPRARDAHAAGQRLLVVDDEPALVALAEEMLAGLGYEAVGYSSPTAALDALRADPRRFDAVITDELMPVLSGTQLTEALREFAPRLPVLLISGYGGALLAQRAAAVGVTRMLAKPLQREELSRALAQVLT